MMAALGDDDRPALVLAAARLRSMSASVNPAPNAPILRKPRRWMPSQKRCLAPQSVSMFGTPLARNTRRREFDLNGRMSADECASYPRPLVGSFPNRVWE